MKKLGIIGGLGPEATVNYYMDIIAGVQKALGNDEILPPVTIESVDMYYMFTLLSTGKYEDTASYLAEAAENLRKAGCDFGLMCGNTAHIVFDEVQARTSLPLMSMVETALEEAKKQKLRKLALLGTKFTMEHDFFQKPFRKAGIEVFIPNKDEINWIHEHLINELEKGIIKKETHDGLVSIVKRMEEQDHVDGVVLGCTELPLILKPEDFRIATLDLSKIHIAAAVRAAVSG